MNVLIHKENAWYTLPLCVLLLVCSCSVFRPGRRNLSSSEYYQKGLSAYQEGKSAEARRNFQLALRENPQMPKAHFYLSVLYAEEGESDLAIVGFRRAVQLEPNFPEALFNLGALLIKRGNYMEAIRMLEHAVKLNPEDAEAFINLGKAYYLLGMPGLAGAAYEEALKIEPENQTARKNLEALLQAAGGPEPDDILQDKNTIRGRLR